MTLFPNDLEKQSVELLFKEGLTNEEVAIQTPFRLDQVKRMRLFVGPGRYEFSVGD